MRQSSSVLERALVFALCGAIALLWTETCRGGESATDAFSGRHVLVIGIDGARPDALQAANTPQLHALIARGAVSYDAFSGGVLGTPTQQETASGAAWTSILTGVWVDKHQVRDNSFKTSNLKKLEGSRITGYPHFFTRIKQKYPQAYLASIVNWKPINDKILSDADYRDTGNDEHVANQCAKLLLGDKNPAVIFLQFDEVDHAGHESKGFSPGSPGHARYLQAIEQCDRQIGVVLDAMKKRPGFAREDWLVVVTADHGGVGKKHGGQSPDERTVFIITSGGGYPQKVVSPGPGIVAIPTLVFRHLGIPIDPSWSWETVSWPKPGERSPHR
jgi:hypothetical protein